nr:glycoside hydrolase [uncultured bacterium]
MARAGTPDTGVPRDGAPRDGAPEGSRPAGGRRWRAILLAILAGCLVAALASFLIWRQLGMPVAMADAPNGKLQCLSYTPFRGKQSPFDGNLVIPPAQIEEDLNKLKQVTGCVRTYATDQGLDQVLPIARDLGMKVLMGIWIGRDPVANEKQLQQGIELGKKYPDALRGIIVGNEVLLRGEQTPAALTGMLKRVREATGVPVTYADVWEFWQPGNDRVGEGLPALAAAADFITIHILPYWEDHPIASDQGVEHLKAIYGILKAAYPDKQVLIGETGFPSAGRQRALAVPSIVDEARYIRDFIAYATSIQLDYNLIEAFDQPWKRASEGTVGGYWGVFSGDRQLKFPLTGPVSNYGDWRQGWYMVLALGAALLATSLLAGPRRLTLWRAATLPVLAAAAGGILVLYARRIGVVAYDWHEIAVELFLWLLGAATAWASLRVLASGQSLMAAPSIVQITDGLPRLTINRRDPVAWLALLQVAALLGATTVSLGLAFDARYRDFPILAFAIPMAAHLILMAARRGRGTIDLYRSDRREEAVLSLILVASSLAIPVIEGPQNHQAMIWTAEALLLALPWVRYWGFFLGRRPVSAFA